MKKGLLLAIGFALAPLFVVAQTLITGHITNVRTGDPLIGGSFFAKYLTIGISDSFESSYLCSRKH